MFPLFFATSGKKVLDPNWPYISMFQTKIRNVCLLVISVFCLSSSVYSVARLQPTPAYVEAWYLLKVRYIIRNHPNLTRFLIFETLCLGRAKTLTYVWKKYHKNEWHLSLVIHSFTKVSQIVCLINLNILVY